MESINQQTAICCTLNNVPLTASTLQKSRLPFAIHVHPFAQDENIPISSDGLIVRCGVCRAYINPYVRIGDQRSWQCNLCNRLNELPPQFYYDYTNQQHYDLGSKVELTCETVEYIASVEYMVRPPQPACYMFVFDCSKAAADTGYIPILAAAIADSLDQIPGDARASIGFIAFDSKVHYFSFTGTRVVHYVSPDLTSPLIPGSVDGLLPNMATKREMILDFLNHTLPEFPEVDSSHVVDTRSALGAAVQVAVKILQSIGGKITVIQAQLANYGNTDDGSMLSPRDKVVSSKINDKNSDHLTPLINPASDFYKNISLEGCEHQISIDLFNLSTTHVDLSSICPLAKYSAGNIYHYSNTPAERKTTLIRFDQDIRNYLIRSLGLEAVLRLRYSRGLKIHTFHGNFFVRSANLLTLPIANPDSSYALQIAIEDDLKPNTRYVYFQASVLYTTPDGERRIRVHTARYPTAANLQEVLYGANQTAIVGMLAKMAVDRSQQASIGEAKEALIGAGVDLLEIYSIADEMRARTYPLGLPENLRMVPLYILALLKHIALRLSPSIKIDDRVAAMERFKSLPLEDLITYIYPDLHPLHFISTDQEEDWRNPISLTAALIERNGAYLLDAYDVIIIYICQYIDPRWCYDVFGVQDFQSIPENEGVRAFSQADQNHSAQLRNHAQYSGASNHSTAPSIYSRDETYADANQMPTVSDIVNAPLIPLPDFENQTSVKLRDYISYLIEPRPLKPKFYIIKETSPARSLFTQYLIDDRSESYHSYAEFWKFLQDQSRK